MIKLNKDEKVVLEVRKHWYELFSETLFLVFVILVPIITAIAGKVIGVSRFIEIEGEGIYLFIIFTAVWFLFVWITFFIIWTNHYLDILIITSKRIIDIDQKGLFSRNVATLMLSGVQDITIEIHGIIATFFGFGDINIQTAGEKREFVIKRIPHPAKVRKKIFSAYNKTLEK
jgi:hypothetical protein